MATIRTNSNPEMLRWAREEVGLTLEQAALALGVSVESLAAAEDGAQSLTLHQLLKAADVYGFPFGYFYFTEPPREKSYKPVPDFRVEPNLIGQDHPRLHLELKRARERREVFLDLAAHLDIEVPPFQTLPKPTPKRVGEFVRERLRVRDSEISLLRFDTVYAYWKEKIENDGVLVYESQYIPAETGVIGAALFYEHAPVILIKRGGAANERKLFTLLHEYAHLLNARSAINDAASQTIDSPRSSEAGLEAMCNQLAAEILVPHSKVKSADYLELAPELKMERMAEIFKVTYSTAAVCLRKLGLITQGDLSQLLDLRRRAYDRGAAAAAKEVRIPRETLARLDFGKPTFNMVLGAYGAGVLDVIDAARILKIRVNKIERLVSRSA
jgi:Zn-dependent peptidase ImmA (M78 family)/DNA-binding XRE family transcriptional regulator